VSWPWRLGLRQSSKQGASTSLLPSPINLRWILAFGVLATEAVWLTSTYRAPDASLAPEWEAFLTVFNHSLYYEALYTGALIFAPVLVLVASAGTGQTFRFLSNQQGYTWWQWAVLHVLALFAFADLTSHGFGAGTGVPALSATWLAGWIAAGTATFVFWLFVLAPPAAWLAVLRQQWLHLVLALTAGTAAWAGGILLQGLWKPLAEGTLKLSALLLSLIYPEVTYNPAQGLVGSDAFMVEIYPVCSGYEGIALVTVFVATYLWIFRKGLSFPRALVLFPIGIISIWLTNVLRVTALIIVGTSISPEVAMRGFHSQAGWIGFTVVTLTLIAISHRWLSSIKAEPRPDALKSGRPEFALLLPLLTLMATSMVIAAASAGFDALYPLGVIATGSVLWHYRAAYRPLFGAWSWEPFAIGTLVFAIWALLVAGNSTDGQSLADRLTAWPAWLAAAWILFRVLGSVITVPLAEELAFRGYLIRKLVAKDFEQVRPGHFTWLSFVASSLLFGLLHRNLLAGALAGAAFALALYRRGLAGDAILAHMTSNALIAVAVLAAGWWGLWA
jgi:exosortase E/protease (VPEID-CTERM system)